MASTRVLTVDLGASGVRGAVFSRRADGGLRLETFASERLGAESADQEPWLAECERALAAIVAQLGVRGPARCALPGHLAMTKHVKTPAVAPSRRERVAHFEAEQTLPLPLTDVAWGYEADEHAADELHLTLGAARIDATERLCAVAEKAGLSLVRAIPASVALQRAFHRQRPDFTGNAVWVNIGARSTHVLWFAGGRHVARTFAFGGNLLTRALAKELKIEVAAAEELKRGVSAGRSELSPNDTTSAIFAHAAEDYARNAQKEIVRSLESLRRQWDCATPETIFLGGGGSLGGKLPALLEEKLRVRVEPFDPLGGIELSEIAVALGAKEPGVFSAELPGLVAFVEEAGGLNLIPPARKAAREFQRRKPVWLAAAALAAITLLPPIWHYRVAAAAAENEAAKLESRLIPLRAARAEMNGKIAEVAELRQRIERLQGIAAGRVNWIAFFADLQARIETVGDAWLEQIVIRRDAPAGESGDAGLRLGISGCLVDVEHPLASGSAKAFARAKRWLAELAQSPFVASISDERFDRSRPGRLRFEATVAVNFEGTR